MDNRHANIKQTTLYKTLLKKKKKFALNKRYFIFQLDNIIE